MGLLVRRRRQPAQDAYAATQQQPPRQEYDGQPAYAPAPAGERAATLVRALEANVAGDSSVVSAIFTDDVCGWSPTITIGSAAELAVELEDREEAFSDIELVLSPLDVAGERAAVEWVVTLTHSGPLEVDDVVLEATGTRVTLHGVTVAEFAGDRIKSFRQYWDEAELLEQLVFHR